MQKEPIWGFLTVMDPFDTFIFHYEHSKFMYTQIFEHNERGSALEASPGDVAQERGELLYHVLLLCVSKMVYCLYFIVNCV